MIVHPAKQRRSKGRALKPSRFVEACLASLKLRPPVEALDIPCGTGRHSQLLGQLGFCVTVSDIDVGLVQSALQALADIGAFGFGSVADASLPLPFPEASFDLVIITDFVDANLLRQIRRYVKPGGILIYESYAARGANWQQLLPRGVTATCLEPYFSIEELQAKLVGPEGAETESLKLLARLV